MDAKTFCWTFCSRKGDLDGQELYFPGTERPEKRLLGIHAMNSWHHAGRLGGSPHCHSSDEGKVENFLYIYGWKEQH